MKTSVQISAFVLSLPILLLAASSRADLLANFLNSDQGWTTYNDAEDFEWDAGKGNIPGSIYAADSAQGSYWGFQAGIAFLQDQSEYIGAEMRWELWVSDINATDPTIPDVSLIAGALTLVNDLGDPPAAQKWVDRVVTLEHTDGWRVGTLDGLAPTADQFEQVMSDLQIIRLRAEYALGADEAWLDNVIFRHLPCYADFDDNHVLNLFDFLAYVNAFNNAKPSADCDDSGSLDLFDFLCYTNAFNAGC